MRLGLALEPDLLVVGEAGDGVAAIKAVQALRPDVVVTDVNMSKIGGITMIEWLNEVAPSVSAIVLTVHDHKEVQAQARAARSRAFIYKQEDVELLIDAICHIFTSDHISSQNCTLKESR